MTEILKISPIIHREEKRIKVESLNTAEFKVLIRKVTGRKWSKTKSYWHIPYTKEAYGELKAIFEHYTIEKLVTTTSTTSQTIHKVQKTLQATPPLEKTIKTEHPTVRIEIENNYRFRVFVPFDQLEWRKVVKEIAKSFWDTEKKYWTLPKTLETIKVLQQKIGEQHLIINFDLSKLSPKTQLVQPLNESVVQSSSPPSAKAILKLCSKEENHIRVYLPNDYIAWRRVLKYIPNSRWKPQGKYWIVPKTQTSIDLLRARIGEASLQATFDISVYPKKSLKEVVPEGMLLGDTITLKKENEKWIQVYVPWNHPIWMETVKSIAGRCWHAEKKCWLVPYVQQSFKILWKHLKPHIDLQFKINPNIPKIYTPSPKPKPKQMKPKKAKSSPAFQKLSVEHQKEVFVLENAMLLRRMAYSTIKAYKAHFIHLLLFYPKKSAEDITLNEIKAYLVHIIRVKQIAWRTQNQIINAIKFYYEQVQHKDKMVFHIPRPKKAKEKIDTLNQYEVVRLLNAVTNLKHKCIVGLLVSSGLRVGEVIKLKVTDIKWERKMVFVKAGKGRKDRLTIVSAKVLSYLKAYIEEYNIIDWLFEGQHGGYYSVRSVQSIVSKAGEDAKLKVRIHPHLLRHTFTTLTRDDGVFSVAEIQHFLGHEHIKTTMGYLHTDFNKIKNKRNFLDGLDV